MSGKTPRKYKIVPGAGITYAEYERAMLLADEAAKLSSAAMRVALNGYSALTGIRGVNLRTELQARIGRVQATVDFMCARGDVSDIAIESHQEKRLKEIVPTSRWQDED